MATTYVGPSSDLAKKVYGAALFAELVRAPGQFNMLTGPAPQEGSALAKLEKMQTSEKYPIVRVTDLSKEGGDRVTVDLFNIIQGIPTMGDERMEGKLMGISSNTDEIKIDQIRGGIDAGGRMSQQRTIHNLRNIAKANLRGWWSRCMNQIKMVHMCGARGTDDSPRWVVPLDTHAKFADIMVNPVLAPTYNRHFYAGDATSVATLDANDKLTIGDIDDLRLRLDEFDVPLQPIALQGDPAAEDHPLFCLLVSPRVWYYLETDTTATAWRTFLMNARERSASNPLFTGGVGMWNGIVVKKMSDQWCEFAIGTDVTVATSAPIYAETTSTAAVVVHRSVLLGAQAMAEVFGKHAGTGAHMGWDEKIDDFGNVYQAVASAMGGYKKLRFRDASATDYDHGVVIIDSAAPDLA